MSQSRVSTSSPPTLGAVTTSTLRGWVMWAMVSVFYGYQFFIRVSPSVMSEELMSSFSVSAGALGVLTSSYYMTYAPLQLPLGMIMDRIGPRRLATLAITLCAFGCLVFSMSSHLMVAQIGRMLMGLGSGCAFLSCMKVASLWLPPRRLALAGGFTMMLGTLGATGAGMPLALLVQYAGWRESIGYLALIGAGLALVVWLIVRDRKIEGELVSARHKKEPMWAGVKEIAANRQSWLIALFTFLMYTPMAVFGDMWGVPFIMQRFCVNCIDASAPASMLYIGIALGAPFFAWLSDFLKSRRLPMLITTVSVIIIFTILLYGPMLSLAETSAFIFAAGFALGGQFLGFPVMCEMNRLSLSGTAVGFNNTICMLSGVLFQPLVGKILDWLWDGKVGEHALRVYSSQSYAYGLAIIPLTAIIATIIVLFIKETYHLADRK